MCTANIKCTLWPDMEEGFNHDMSVQTRGAWKSWGGADIGDIGIYWQSP